MCWLIRNHHYNFIRKSYKILCGKMQNASSQNAKCFVAECKMLRYRMQNTSSQNAKYFVTEWHCQRDYDYSSHNCTSGHHGREAAMDEWPPWTSGCHRRVAAMDE